MKTRWHTAIENLKGASGLRPKDYGNFFNMLLEMPKPNTAGEHPPIHPAQVALQMFTTMNMQYEPTKGSHGMSTYPIQKAESHIIEPTVSLFVDAPDHLSGVSLTLRSWAEEAKQAGMPFFLHMAGSAGRMPGAKAFPKVGTLRMNSYKGLDVPIPDVKVIKEYMSNHPFDVAHLSTPGPMGLLGMRIAQSLGAPICGTYHTDFPRYVRDLTGNEELEAFTWQYMKWFYGQMDVVAAPSSATRDDLIAHGLDGDRIHVVGRGVETDVFSPRHRSEALRQKWNAGNKPVLLFVGRVSKEKNLPLLADAYRQCADQAILVVVGDGPYLEDMQQALRDTPAVFTGALKGDDLSQAFASADLFTFPSVTDTFGRVLIEAQASGLPVLVSNEGGPRDTVDPERSGRIVTEITADRFADAILEVLSQPQRLSDWKHHARQHALNYTPEASFNAFWHLHRIAIQHPQGVHHAN